MRNLIFLYCCLLSIVSSAQYTGGNGRNDVMTSTSTSSSFATTWDQYQNNRVLTRSAFASAANTNVFTATNLASLGTTLQAISAFTLTLLSISVTSVQPGIIYVADSIRTSSTPRQLLIKGDFRSIRINNSTQPTSCADKTVTTFNQTIWLNEDYIVENVTSCFIDKTLSTPFAGNGNYYQIAGSIAIRINSNGLITEYCLQ